MRFKRAIILAAVLAAANVRAAEESWSICSVPDAPFHLQVPATLIHSTATTATGCSFQTQDAEFNVEAVIQENTGEPLEVRMQKEIELLSGNVDRKQKGDDWFLLSGVTPDGTEYFRKLFTQNGQWVTLRITYPHAQRKKYEDWVKRIEKTFVPFATTAQSEKARANGEEVAATYADSRKTPRTIVQKWLADQSTK